jgi:hypothetical protein
LLRRDYKGKQKSNDDGLSLAEKLQKGINDQTIAVPDLVSGYCTLLYKKLGTYEKVAQLTGLDRRTIKKHITNFKRIR